MKRQNNRRLQRQNKSRRIRIIAFAFILVLAGTTFLFKSNLISAPNPLKLSDRTEETSRQSLRGSILDRNLKELAASYHSTAVYARPLELIEPEIAASMLAGILKLNEKELAAELKSERSFIWLGRNIEQADADKIAGLDLKGIYLEAETKRFYPYRRTAAHLVGFIKDKQGLDGVEFQFDNILRGESSPIREIPALKLNGRGKAGIKNADLVLTLDLQSQELLEKHLATAIKSTGAVSGMAALMDPTSGAILAMVNLPSFDPNNFWEYSEEIRKNRIISELLLPTVLSVSDISGVDDQLPTDKTAGISPGSTPVLFPDKTKKRVDSSSGDNTLTVFEYLADFDRRFELDLPMGSAANDRKAFSPGFKDSKNTALQLLSAFSCFVNGGLEIFPHLLQSIRDHKTNETITATYETGSNGIIPESTRKAFLHESDRSGINGPSDSLLLKPLTVYSRYSRTEPPDSDPAAKRNISILLGSIPREEPKVTFIAVLEHNRPEDLISSAMLSLGREVLPEILQSINTPVQNPPPVATTAKTGQTADRIQKEDSAAATITTKAEPLSRMPKVTGRSLRNGLQILQQYQLKISLNGSGTIVDQEPEPGALIDKGDICKLKLNRAN